MTASADIPSVRLPRSAVTTLSHRCAGLGVDGIEALREAGYRAGTEIFARLDEAPGELDAADFWERLDAAFVAAGLGSLQLRSVDPSMGAIAWSGSAEAAGAHADRDARCHFGAGLLGGVLSRAAERTVDVVEVRCGGGGAEPCWFLFGSVDRLRRVRQTSATSATIPSGPARPLQTPDR